MLNEYQVISPMNNELSIIDYHEVTNVVEKKFSKNLIQEIGDSENMLQEWGIQDSSIYLVYNKEGLNVLIEKKFKKDFESKTKLKLKKEIY